MIIMSWNCRGLENHSAVWVFADVVRSKGPNILFLMETKLSVNDMILIRDELGYRSMLAVPSVRRSGGLALLWKDDVTVNAQTYSLNHIDAKIMVSPQVEGHLTGVYGHLKDQRNKETWLYCGISILGPPCHGFALVILMKSCHLMKKVVVCLSHWGLCRIFGAPCCIVIL